MKKLFLILGLTTKLLAGDNFVVCIHGLMGGPWCMKFLQKNLTQDGWDVINWGYPSTDDYIQNHGQKLVTKLNILAKEKPGKPIHFVTHSMGSLVLLSALNHPNAPLEAKIGRMVLIAPPLQGSAWARWLSKFALARRILKPYSGKELTTMKSYLETFGDYPDSIEKTLVIAGNLGFNPILKAPNDGTVSVNETHLLSPHQHVVVKSGHKTIFNSKKVSKLTREFLKSI